MLFLKKLLLCLFALFVVNSKVNEIILKSYIRYSSCCFGLLLQCVYTHFRKKKTRESSHPLRQIKTKEKVDRHTSLFCAAVNC